MISGPFLAMVSDGMEKSNQALVIKGVLNIGFTVFIIGAVVIIVSQAVTRWVNQSNGRAPIAPSPSGRGPG
jgi:hypothetical protein